jgi:hypothetical protein
VSYRLLVTGSRSWTNVHLLRGVLRDVHREHPDAVLVSGRCRGGADAFAELCWASFCGFPTAAEAIAAGRIEPHPADWDQFGDAAGPKRNGEMVAAGADECVSFWEKGAGNRGTASCVGLARKAGIPVREFWSP